MRGLHQEGGMSAQVKVQRIREFGIVVVDSNPMVHGIEVFKGKPLIAT